VSNDPPDFRPPRAPSGLHWLPPVSLGAEPEHAAGERELEGMESSPPDHHAADHAPDGPGLLSELVLTAMVALGVTLATCAALYAAGVFNAPVQQSAPAISHGK
jgi:hypothetical protein